MGRKRGGTNGGAKVLADHCPAKRVCLRCAKTFASKGPGNRICGACDVANRQVYLAKGER